MFVGYLPYPLPTSIIYVYRYRAYKRVIMHGAWAATWQTKYSYNVHIWTENVKRTATAGKWGFGGENTRDRNK